MELKIVQPPWSNLGRRLESATRKALHEYGMLEGVDKIAVALSGGKDSLALLYLLKAISGFGVPKFDLHAIHVSGEFTCGAGVGLDYLRDICTRLGINLVILESTQKLETLQCYSCSRERRSLLFKAAKDLGISTIAFGHHRDDNAQTLMMNLLHRGEFEGLLPKIPMHRYGVTIIRPLIYLREEEIRTFAAQQGFARITCRCPVGENAMRKQIDSLLGDMEKLFPNTRGNIATAALRYSSGKAAQEPPVNAIEEKS